ncbi:hypothetical protein Lrub_2666 [Legionella rubrilucens]|uniref:Dot/Icm T4SS effector n=1 Tax=Legionella rubrilucens TaxID=458 RepID=A0A0W0XME9_9GAMM|nr:hypothetical protein [Legionella rubrilucens]KTD45869.1 hypothetical protein Lrub_2666 [Legionella rubrilucens]
MFSKSQPTRIQLSPQQQGGDCGYQVITLGLFYLALRAASSSSLQERLDNSKALACLLTSVIPPVPHILLQDKSSGNAKNLLHHVQAVASGTWDSPGFDEILSSFTVALKQRASQSTWLPEQVKQKIKSGLWFDDYCCWENYPSFKAIKEKVICQMDELYARLSKKDACDFEKIQEVMFNSRVTVCNQLSDEELLEPVNEVIRRHYQDVFKKAWLDCAFLKALTADLLGCADLFFSGSDVMITGCATDSNHWSIELPGNEASEKLISLYQQGYQKTLSIHRIYPNNSNCFFKAPLENNQEKIKPITLSFTS